MSTSDSRRSVRFADRVAPGDADGPNDIQLTKRIEKPATVEELRVRIYRGAELALRIRPVVIRDQRTFPLLDYGGDEGKEYVDGDGDQWTYPTSEQVEEANEVGVIVENHSTEYAYDFACDVVLDRAGGTDRSLFSFVGGLL